MAERSLGERLLEVGVYLPVGIAVTVAEELPALAEKGRSQLEKNLKVANVIGRFAVAEAQRRINRGPGARRPEAPSTSLRAEETARPQPSGGAVRVPPAAGAASSRDASALPIPGYDTLAASQVVQRLPSLSRDELEAVRRYEMATRGRRTILHRIAQLTTTASPS